MIGASMSARVMCVGREGGLVSCISAMPRNTSIFSSKQWAKSGQSVPFQLHFFWPSMTGDLFTKWLINRTIQRSTAMKQRQQGHKTARAKKAVKHRTRSVKSAKRRRHDGDLEKTLSLIRTHPGIRPSELNRLLKRDQSDGLRNTLIERGLIRKEKDGSATRYYPA
jgi:hypothetical protein